MLELLRKYSIVQAVVTSLKGALQELRTTETSVARLRQALAATLNLALHAPSAVAMVEASVLPLLVTVLNETQAMRDGADAADVSMAAEALMKIARTEELRDAIRKAQVPSSPPLTPHPSPLTPHPSPLTSHLSPLTSHPSPLTSHLSPPTSHLSPPYRWWVR